MALLISTIIKNMTPINYNEQNIKNLLRTHIVIEERYPVVSYGKELLQSPKPLQPVSEIIKKYIKDQFSVLDNK